MTPTPMDTLLTTIIGNATTVLTDIISDNWIAVLTLVLGVAVIASIARLVKRAPGKVFGGR